MKKIALLSLPILIVLLMVGYASTAAGQTTDTNLQNNLDQLRKSRQDFKDVKAQKDSSLSEENKAKTQALREAAKKKKEEAQKRMEEKRKEVLLKLVDIQIRWMNNIKDRVQKMPNISDELKTKLAAEVDATVQKLTEFKTQVQNAADKEAIKALAQEIRDFVKSKHEIVKKVVNAIHAYRANNAIAKAQERLAAIKARIQELKDQGKDTAKLEALLKEAEEKLEAALKAIGLEDLTGVNEDLKIAYQKFREIAQLAKGL